MAKGLRGRQTIFVLRCRMPVALVLLPEIIRAAQSEPPGGFKPQTHRLRGRTANYLYIPYKFIRDSVLLLPEQLDIHVLI